VNPEERLNPQEFLGVLSTRLAHRLSNYVSVMAGNLAIHDLSKATPEQREAALTMIRDVTRRAGELLDCYADLARSLRPKASECLLPDLLENISNWAESRSEARIEISAQLADWKQYALAGPWKWLAFALDAIAQNATQLTVSVDRGTKPNTPSLIENPAAYLSITIQTRGIEPIEWHAHREAMKSWPLTAAYELLQYLGTRPVSKSSSNGEQETRLIFPLIEGVRSEAS
jgi:hypothetical protein